MASHGMARERSRSRHGGDRGRRRVSYGSRGTAALCSSRSGFQNGRSTKDAASARRELDDGDITSAVHLDDTEACRLRERA